MHQNMLLMRSLALCFVSWQIHIDPLISRGLVTPLSEPFATLTYDFNNPSVEIRKVVPVKVRATPTGMWLAAAPHARDQNHHVNISCFGTFQHMCF